MPFRPLLALLLPTLLSAATPEVPSPAAPPRVLLVDAHPDDEGAYAGAIYKLTHDLKAVVDLAVLTNGEGGYKYATLAEPIYGLKLTDEAVGRKHLPAIRKRELESAGRIIGLRSIFHFDQKDHRYTKNPADVLSEKAGIWDLPAVRTRLQQLLREGRYDFVFTLLPLPGTHGHHKAATILALEAVRNLPKDLPRPLVLGTTVFKKGKPPEAFSGLDGYPDTKAKDGTYAYTFDLTQGFGYRKALTYHIVVNWEIAEHKSQGTMQLVMNRGDVEAFWYYDLNPPEGRAKAQALFDALARPTYPELTYPDEEERALPKD